MTAVLAVARAVLGALPAWIWSALLTASVAGAVLLERQATIADLRTDLSTVQRVAAVDREVYASQRATAWAAHAEALQQARQAEQEARQRIEEIARATETEIAAQRAAAARADGAAGQLRRQLSDVRARADAAEARAGASAAELAALREAGRLADGLGDCSDRYRAVAARHDEAVSRGLACESAYDAGRRALAGRDRAGDAIGDTGVEPPNTQPDGAR